VCFKTFYLLTTLLLQFFVCKTSLNSTPHRDSKLIAPSHLLPLIPPYTHFSTITSPQSPTMVQSFAQRKEAAKLKQQQKLQAQNDASSGSGDSVEPETSAAKRTCGDESSSTSSPYPARPVGQKSLADAPPLSVDAAKMPINLQGVFSIPTATSAATMNVPNAQGKLSSFESPAGMSAAAVQQPTTVMTVQHPAPPAVVPVPQQPLSTVTPVQQQAPAPVVTPFQYRLLPALMPIQQQQQPELLTANTPWGPVTQSTTLNTQMGLITPPTTPPQHHPTVFWPLQVAAAEQECAQAASLFDVSTTPPPPDFAEMVASHPPLFDPDDPSSHGPGHLGPEVKFYSREQKDQVWRSRLGDAHPCDVLQHTHTQTIMPWRRCSAITTSIMRT
jgi:hypothetical protein